MFRARLGPQPEAVLGWLRELPGPVAVLYEAGPTGSGLARFLTDHNIRCVVAAPSKLQRPSGDRVKTDAKDAQHLARLLRLDEITPVVVPTVAQEAARDLVRAREDVRGDLMRARHRTSKLLLRQGTVWSGGTRVDGRAPRLAAAADVFPVGADHRLRQRAGDGAAVRGAPGPPRQGDRQDGRRPGLVGDRHPAGVPARGVDVDRVRVDGGGRGLVEVHRLEHRGVSGSGADRALQRRQPQPRLDHQDREHPRPPATGGGRLAAPTSATLRSRWNQAPAAARARGHAGNQRLHQRWQVFTDRKKRPVVANVAIARELAGWCWSLAMLDDTRAAC